MEPIGIPEKPLKVEPAEFIADKTDAIERINIKINIYLENLRKTIEVTNYKRENKGILRYN